MGIMMTPEMVLAPAPRDTAMRGLRGAPSSATDAFRQCRDEKYSPTPGTQRSMLCGAQCTSGTQRSTTVMAQCYVDRLLTVSLPHDCDGTMVWSCVQF